MVNWFPALTYFTYCCLSKPWPCPVAMVCHCAVASEVAPEGSYLFLLNLNIISLRVCMCLRDGQARARTIIIGTTVHRKSPRSATNELLAVNCFERRGNLKLRGRAMSSKPQPLHTNIANCQDTLESQQAGGLGHLEKNIEKHNRILV